MLCCGYKVWLVGGVGSEPIEQVEDNGVAKFPSPVEVPCTHRVSGLYKELDALLSIMLGALMEAMVPIVYGQVQNIPPILSHFIQLEGRVILDQMVHQE